MLNNNTGMIVEESLVLVAEVCWGTSTAHRALGAGRSLKTQVMSQQWVLLSGLTNPCTTQ